MVEERCSHDHPARPGPCGALLFKVTSTSQGIVETKCKRCGNFALVMFTPSTGAR